MSCVNSRGKINDLTWTQRNLQNLPSTGSIYAKPVKAIFRAPPGYVYVGSDFASLEDRISALTTKDENKLKVYTGLKGYKLTLNGIAHIISGGTMVEYDGKLITGDQLYEILQNSQSWNVYSIWRWESLFRKIRYFFKTP